MAHSCILTGLLMIVKKFHLPRYLMHNCWTCLHICMLAAWLKTFLNRGCPRFSACMPKHSAHDVTRWDSLLPNCSSMKLISIWKYRTWIHKFVLENLLVAQNCGCKLFHYMWPIQFNQGWFITKSWQSFHMPNKLTHSFLCITLFPLYVVTILNIF